MKLISLQLSILFFLDIVCLFISLSIQLIGLQQNIHVNTTESEHIIFTQ